MCLINGVRRRLQSIGSVCLSRLYDAFEECARRAAPHRARGAAPVCRPVPPHRLPSTRCREEQARAARRLAAAKCSGGVVAGKSGEPYCVRGARCARQRSVRCKHSVSRAKCKQRCQRVRSNVCAGVPLVARGPCCVRRRYKDGLPTSRISSTMQHVCGHSTRHTHAAVSVTAACGRVSATPCATSACCLDRRPRQPPPRNDGPCSRARGAVRHSWAERH